jgi:phage terminase large subunit
MEIDAQFPEALGFLFQPARYKVCHGGRGSSKSWGYARALLLLGVAKPLRILCTREVQKSIKDSVHRLLSDQIQLLGLGPKYHVIETEIRGTNGTSFIFSGLAEQTVESIKSFEGCDIVWCEEAQVISKRSWDILIPTIRKDKSEIWITMNPELESDPTYERFIKNPPPSAIVAQVNWRDNPWFNDVLESERLYCYVHNPDDYPNIWEGRCKPAVEGAIFFKEVQAMEAQGRIRDVPYDPMLRAHVVFDLGFNDEMAIAVVQKLTSEIRIINYIEDTHRTLAEYSADLKEMRYNWGKVWLPFSDGFSRDFKTGKGADEILKALGWDVAKKEQVANIDVETGIKIARMTFPRFYVDRTRCAKLIESWKRYKRHVNRQTGEGGAPFHDSASHGGDCTRYIATNIDNMTNSVEKKQAPRGVSFEVLDEAVGY